MATRAVRVRRTLTEVFPAANKYWEFQKTVCLCTVVLATLKFRHKHKILCWTENWIMKHALAQSKLILYYLVLGLLQSKNIISAILIWPRLECCGEIPGRNLRGKLWQESWRESQQESWGNLSKNSWRESRQEILGETWPESSRESWQVPWWKSWQESWWALLMLEETSFQFSKEKKQHLITYNNY